VTQEPFEIRAAGIDSAKIVDQIRQTVARKRESGAYADAEVARAERANLSNLRDDDEFMDLYLDSLRDAVQVDINDFDILERRSRLGSLFIGLKKLIWKVLKFYTYRLWSQQNEVNALMLSAVDSMDARYRSRIEALEARIRAQEEAQTKTNDTA